MNFGKSHRLKSFIFHFPFFILPASLLTGCFTVSETAYPAYPMTKLPGASDVSVQLRGFETTFVDTIPIHSYQSVYVPGCYGYCHAYPGHFETVTATTYIEQARNSTQFAEQAEDRMESAGFGVHAAQPDYLVEARFEGPYPGPHSPGCWRPLLWLGTLLTSDRSACVWKAKLKIYDNRTGKLAFTRDCEEEYSVACFSPIPVLGPMGYERTAKNYMQAWCMMALTDKLTSEASAFIAAQRDKR